MAENFHFSSYLCSRATKAESELDGDACGSLILFCKSGCDDFVGFPRHSKGDEGEMHRPFSTVSLSLLIRHPAGLHIQNA